MSICRICTALCVCRPWMQDTVTFPASNCRIYRLSVGVLCQADGFYHRRRVRLRVRPTSSLFTLPEKCDL